jgi:hypothetical protein
VKLGTKSWNVALPFPVGQPFPVAVQFLRQAMRLPYNFSGSKSSSEGNSPEIIRGI